MVEDIFYDMEGNEARITPFVNKTSGLGIEDIKNENVICVAGLEMKAEAIL